MKTSYYNTTHSTHPDLTKYEESAVSQEVKILDWFKKGVLDAPPSEIRYCLFDDGVPITSVRRALTNLTNAGELVKTDKQVPGPYGRPEYQWRLAPKYDQREMF